MNRDTAELLVSQMNAVFPPLLSEVGFETYVRELVRLVDEEAAVKAVESLIRSSLFMPKPVEIVDAYRSYARRRTDQLRALELEQAEEIARTLGLPRPEREPIPEHVRDWMKRRGIDLANILRDIEPTRGGKVA